MKVMKIKLLPLLISLAVPLGLGRISAFLTRNSMHVYRDIIRPFLSPPGFIFPIVWTILFVLMGIASYIVYISYSPSKSKALIIYGVQLIFNFVWSLLFFNMRAYLFSFIWLIVLIILIAITMFLFAKINKYAGLLMLPYLLWCIFAAYLNFFIFLFN